LLDGAAAPDPAAYGSGRPAVSPPTVLRGRGRIFPAPARGNPHPGCREQQNAGPALTSAFDWGDDDPGFGSNQRGWRMPTYVSLIHWTDQGVKNFKDSTSRAADFTKLAESSGGRVRELLWTVGEYDIVTVVDFPDDETATAALLRVGSLGSIRSNTLRAFNAGEIEAIFERAG